MFERPVKSSSPSSVRRQNVNAKTHTKQPRPKPTASPSQGGGRKRPQKRRSSLPNGGPRKRTKIATTSLFQLVEKATVRGKVVKQSGTKFSIVIPAKARYHSFTPARLLTKKPSLTTTRLPTEKPRKR